MPNEILSNIFYLININRCCRWAQMITEKQHYLIRARLIKISPFLIWLDKQKFLVKNTGTWFISDFRSFTFFYDRHLSINREKLCGHLPARAEGYAWSLVFSTSLHGFSLNSLYRKMHKLESPVLIVIQDTEQNVSSNGRLFNDQKDLFEFLFHFILLGVWCFNILLTTCIWPLLWNWRIVTLQI